MLLKSSVVKAYASVFLRGVIVFSVPVESFELPGIAPGLAQSYSRGCHGIAPRRPELPGIAQNCSVSPSITRIAVGVLYEHNHN